MEKKNFSREISVWSEEFGYMIDGDYLIIPTEKTSKFLEQLMQNKPFKKES